MMSYPGVFFRMLHQPPRPTLFPYTTLFRSVNLRLEPYGSQKLSAINILNLRASRDFSLGHGVRVGIDADVFNVRSEEHTSELQSRVDLVCRLLLEKKKFPRHAINSGCLRGS